MLFEDLSTYALGYDHFAGVAMISGDAGGFDGMSEPLDEREIAGILRSYLRGEETQSKDDVVLLEGLVAQCENDALISEIHLAHVRRFARR